MAHAHEICSSPLSTARKLKCDGGRPACGQCVKRANHCDYQPVLRRARKNDADTDAATGPLTELASLSSTETLTNHSPLGLLRVVVDSSEIKPTKREHSPVSLAISSLQTLPPSASGSRRPSGVSTAPSLSTHVSPPAPLRGLVTIDEDSKSSPAYRSPNNTTPRPLTSHSRSSSQSRSSERSGAEMTTTLPPLVTIVGHRDRDKRIVSAPGVILDDVHSAARQHSFAESGPTLPPIQLPLSADMDMAHLPYPDTRPRAFKETNWSSGRRGSDQPAGPQWSGEERRQPYDAVSRRQEQAQNYDEREYVRYDASQQAPPPSHTHAAAQRHRRTASLPGPHSNSAAPPMWLPPPSTGFRHPQTSPHHQHHALLSPHHAGTHHSPSQNPQSLNSPGAGMLSPRERLPGIPLPRGQPSSAAAHTPMAHTAQAPHLSGATPVPPSPPISQSWAAAAVSPDRVAAARERYADRMDVDSEFSPPRATPSLPPTSAAPSQHRPGAYPHAIPQHGTPPPQQLYSPSDPRIPKNPRFGPKTVACTFCRQRKTKCDGAHPRCSNCAKRGQSCEYMEDLRRRVTGPHATVDSEGWPLEGSRSPGDQTGHPGASTAALHAGQRRMSVPPGPAALPGLILSPAEPRVTGDGQRLKKLTPVVSTSDGSEDDGSEPPRKKVRMEPPPTSNTRGNPLRAGAGW
ncbi:hypothetical protein BKA62DRAFT_303103 [Auriculariales sp. MPI-PUGE-AT-0066]|nr:hypothetical protein BKA62DRAFT_303103 [Auriculariales sp. MPI-PUGE-AT-0066]